MRGVRVIYVEETFQSEASPHAAIMKSMKRVVAAEFSRERSAAVQADHCRVLRQGFLRGGPVPYGVKRILVSLDGTFIQDLARGDRQNC